VGATVTIAERFHGPPKSGNGGYVCGCAARFIDGPAEVTLRAPPPLETPLDVVREGDEIVLRDGAQDIARAKRATLDIEAPPAPSHVQAVQAAQGFRGHEAKHFFSTCFVCGPHHETGLRLTPGVLKDNIVACAWTPAADLAGADGKIADEFLWAALDCPSYWALPHAGDKPSVLGRLTAKIISRPAPGDALTITAWPLHSDGRKHHAASALYDASGAVLAISRAVWIEVPAEQFA
jgi:hypothetical protein